MLNALCYAELASRFPAVVGGAYLYTYTAFNELTAFLVFAQLMLDYHIGAASIARSLASYVVTILELFPIFKENIPDWIGHGGQQFLGGALSLNLLAPILLALLTIVLCRGVGESSAVNSFMTATKVSFPGLLFFFSLRSSIVLHKMYVVESGVLTLCQFSCRLSSFSLSSSLVLLRSMFQIGLLLPQMVLKKY